VSSSNVPASAGVIPAGGFIHGRDGKPGIGIASPVPPENETSQQSPERQKRRWDCCPETTSAGVNGPGSLRMPFGMKMSMVMPPRIGSGFLVSNEASEPLDFSAGAARSRRPVRSGESLGTQRSGNGTRGNLPGAEAWSIGTGQSFAGYIPVKLVVIFKESRAVCEPYVVNRYSARRVSDAASGMKIFRSRKPFAMGRFVL